MEISKADAEHYVTLALTLLSALGSNARLRAALDRHLDQAAALDQAARHHREQLTAATHPRDAAVALASAMWCADARSVAVGGPGNTDYLVSRLYLHREAGIPPGSVHRDNIAAAVVLAAPRMIRALKRAPRLATTSPRRAG